MQNQHLRVEYIYHSGFVVESEKHLLVFDYFQGAVNLNKGKPIYVFSSHAHADHFNSLILDWQREHPDIHYIFSSDIRSELRDPLIKDNITFLSPYQETKIDNLSIKTFGSTDVGVSFLVEHNGIRLFHAGDLNWWYWWGETAEEIAQAEKGFKEEMAKIKGESIDVAFFPVDPRLEHNYSLGAEYFIREIQPKILIPMHFGQESDVINAFVQKTKNSPTKIIKLTSRGQFALL